MAPRTFRPIDQLEAEWHVTSRTRTSREALSQLAAREESVARLGALDLGELVERLRAARGAEQRVEAARVLQAMLRSQACHPLVPRAILQALVPGLVSVARRLSWGAGGDWEGGGAFFADLLATAWEVIVEWSGDDRAYAVLDLLSAVRCRARRQLVRQREAGAAVAPEPDVDRQAVDRTDLGSTALEDLARALEDVSGRGVAPADAAVLYGHRVLGLSMAELAALTGESRRILDGRRQRAEQELCA